MTAYFCLKSRMNIDFLLLDNVHRLGESATGRSRGFRQHGYKKCRVEITINFARLLSTRPARTIAHLCSPRRPASPSIPLRSIPLHEVEREAICTLLPQAGEGMGGKHCFDGWCLAGEPEKCTLAPVQLPNPGLSEHGQSLYLERRIAVPFARSGSSLDGPPSSADPWCTFLFVK